MNDSETILNAARALKTAVGNKGEIGFNVTAGKIIPLPFIIRRRIHMEIPAAN